MLSPQWEYSSCPLLHQERVLSLGCQTEEAASSPEAQGSDESTGAGGEDQWRAQAAHRRELLVLPTRRGDIGTLKDILHQFRGLPRGLWGRGPIFSSSGFSCLGFTASFQSHLKPQLPLYSLTVASHLGGSTGRQQVAKKE